MFWRSLVKYFSWRLFSCAFLEHLMTIRMLTQIIAIKITVKITLIMVTMCVGHLMSPSDISTKRFRTFTLVSPPWIIISQPIAFLSITKELVPFSISLDLVVADEALISCHSQINEQLHTSGLSASASFFSWSRGSWAASKVLNLLFFMDNSFKFGFPVNKWAGISENCSLSSKVNVWRLMLSMKALWIENIYNQHWRFTENLSKLIKGVQFNIFSWQTLTQPAPNLFKLDFYPAFASQTLKFNRLLSSTLFFFAEFLADC